MKNVFRIAFLAAAGLLATAADAPSLAALNALQSGKWTLTSRDASFASRSVCLGDPRVLLQVKQPGRNCSRFVITNEAELATLSYTCPGVGSGRTTIRVETPRLVQLETQGITGGTPFNLSLEARRTGECATLSQR